MLIIISFTSALATTQGEGCYLVRKLRLEEEKLTCLRSSLIYERKELKLKPR